MNVKKAIIATFYFISFCTGAYAQTPTNVPCLPCEELKTLTIPDVVLVEASQRSEPVDHCKVLGTIGTEINFELLLPLAWNARFAMSGNGGFAGSINFDRTKIVQGYAISATDTGHKGVDFEAAWAYNNPERQLNYAYLAIHRTAVVSKEIIRQYYGKASEYSYFKGCSTGGGQGMMEAQRYPDDFDGIVTGAPAFNRTAYSAEFVQNAQAAYPDPTQLASSIISSDNLKLLDKMIMSQCDALDGLTDGILNDPRECKFDFDQLPMVTDDQIRNGSFTAIQLDAVKAVYAGVADQEKQIYPGFPFGNESERGAWPQWIVGPNEQTMASNFPSIQFAIGTEMFKYIIMKDPNWDYSKYDFSNFSAQSKLASSLLDATSTNYEGFKSSGGKMIIYHGWSDYALSAFATINHYEAARKVDDGIHNYIRLFLLPGVLHCKGGPGPDSADWLELIRDWVENGNAPERVIMTKWKEGSKVMQRPVFPYPRKTVYKGSGDPSKEFNFD